MKPLDTKTIACPTCRVVIYEINQHECEQCEAKVCFYCEEDHAAKHRKDANESDNPSDNGEGNRPG